MPKIEISEKYRATSEVRELAQKIMNGEFSEEYGVHNLGPSGGAEQNLPPMLCHVDAAPCEDFKKPTDQPTTEPRKLGRPKGRKNSRPPKPTESPLYSALAKLEVNDYVFREGTFDEMRQVQRRCNVNDSRRPPEMHGKKFATSVFTAISATDAQEIIYLIKIWRIE